MNIKIVPFDELAGADLIVDAIYLGGRANNAADDPINVLTRSGNMGGFRKVGRKQQTKYVVLCSSQSDPDWPDQLDPSTGLFTYYGDNKTILIAIVDVLKLKQRVITGASPSRRRSGRSYADTGRSGSRTRAAAAHAPRSGRHRTGSRRSP